MAKKPVSTVTTMDHTLRTTVGLREALFDELDKLRNGVSNPGKSNAIANLTDKICATVRIDMEVQRFMEKYGNKEVKLPSEGTSLIEE